MTDEEIKTIQELVRIANNSYASIETSSVSETKEALLNIQNLGLKLLLKKVKELEIETSALDYQQSFTTQE